MFASQCQKVKTKKAQIFNFNQWLELGDYIRNHYEFKNPKLKSKPIYLDPIFKKSFASFQYSKFLLRLITFDWKNIW